MISDEEGNNLALFYPKAERLKEKKDQITFISDEDHLVQVGIWNRYTTKHAIEPHTHLPLERQTIGTHEMFYVESGRIIAYIFDAKNRPCDKIEMNQGDILVQLAGGHTFEILEDETSVIEVKNGPFMGRAADKVLIEVEQ